jgi:hypothetical protein
MFTIIALTMVLSNETIGLLTDIVESPKGKKKRSEKSSAYITGHIKKPEGLHAHHLRVRHALDVDDLVRINETVLDCGGHALLANDVRDGRLA